MKSKDEIVGWLLMGMFLFVGFVLWCLFVLTYLK